MKISSIAYNKFFENVQIGAKDECWIWAGGISGNGYGYIYDGNKYISAHRTSWSIYNNQLSPKNYFICHTCDNKLCVNPHHLYRGTHKENTIDAINRNRTTKGMRNPRSKLTDENIREILSIDYSRTSMVLVGEKYNVSSATICRIVNRQIWTHIGLPEE